MDTPDNYYAILGVPLDAGNETLKRAYRQLARRYHPDLAGPDGEVQMKRINRAYDVLSDPQKRLNYDTIIGGVIDLRKGGLTRARAKPQKFEEDSEFSGLSIFSTKGPFHAGLVLHTTLGVISALSSLHTASGSYIAAGSLDGTGQVWQAGSTGTGEPVHFTADPSFTVESLRELRFSPDGQLLAGWGRLGFQVWEVQSGAVLWSYALRQRAVSAHYSLDTVLLETADGRGEARIALPLLTEDPRAPRSQGVRGTDVVRQPMGVSMDGRNETMVCVEDELAKRQFWAIRLRALAQDAHTLLTLSCARSPGETEEMIILRRWDLAAQTRFGKKRRARITSSILAGPCGDCAPPYAVNPAVDTVAFVHMGQKIRLYDTQAGTYSELPSGTMGASSKLALSANAQWVAVAREDSEVTEGVVDLWSVNEGQLVQKLYHPWQISALHFAEQRLVVALTDGTIQIWE